MELTVCVSTDQPLLGGITNNEQDTQEEKKMMKEGKRKRKGEKGESVREKNQKRNKKKKKKKKKQPTQKIEFSLTAFSRVFLPNQRAERGFSALTTMGQGY